MGSAQTALGSAVARPGAERPPAACPGAPRRVNGAEFSTTRHRSRLPPLPTPPWRRPSWPLWAWEIRYAHAPREPALRLGERRLRVNRRQDLQLQPQEIQPAARQLRSAGPLSNSLILAQMAALILRPGARDVAEIGVLSNVAFESMVRELAELAVNGDSIARNRSPCNGCTESRIRAGSAVGAPPKRGDGCRPATA